MQRVTEKFQLPDDYITYRKVDPTYLKEFLGIDISGNGKGFNWHNKNSRNAALDALKNQINSKTIAISDKAVTSVSMVEGLNYFKMRPVLFEIQTPKGTKGMLTNNYEESEFIAARNSRLVFLGAEEDNYNENGRKKYGIRIFARMEQDNEKEGS